MRSSLSHGEDRAAFRNSGGTLTLDKGPQQLAICNEVEWYVPCMDDRLRLDAFELNGKVRSVSNRRLWGLQEWQAELKKTSVPAMQENRSVHKKYRKFNAGQINEM